MQRILSGLGMAGLSSTSSNDRSAFAPLAAGAGAGHALAAVGARRLGQRDDVRPDRSTMPPSTTAPILAASAWRKLTNRMGWTLGRSDELCEAFGETNAVDGRGQREWGALCLRGLLLGERLSHRDRTGHAIEQRRVDGVLQLGCKASEASAAQDPDVGAVLAHAGGAALGQERHRRFGVARDVGAGRG